MPRKLPNSVQPVVKHLNRCILPSLRHTTSPPNSDDDIVELSERVDFSFVGQDLQELGRETIGPYSVRQRTDRLLYFVPRRDIIQWSAQGPLLKLVHNTRVTGRRLDVKQFMKPPHPPLADEVIPQQSTFLVLDVLRVKRPLPFHNHPLYVFEEVKLITFWDTLFELADVIFEEPLYSFSRNACVSAVWWSPSRLAVDHDHLEQNGTISSRLPYPAIVQPTPLSSPRSHTSPSVLVCAE